MKTKFALAGLAGGVVTHLLGWLIYGILLSKFFEANTLQYEGLMKEMPVMWLLILSNLAGGNFLTFVFYHWANISTLKGGFIGGLIIGLFVGFIVDLSLFASMNLYNAAYIIVDILAFSIIYGITGAIVGCILGLKQKAG